LAPHRLERRREDGSRLPRPWLLRDTRPRPQRGARRLRPQEGRPRGGGLRPRARPRRVPRGSEPRARRLRERPPRRALTTVAKAKVRCPWAGDDPLYHAYHDEEWGLPLHDDRALFELLNLEGAQAGLSWITILRKRPAYRRAFAGFDAKKVARF